MTARPGSKTSVVLVASVLAGAALTVLGILGGRGEPRALAQGFTEVAYEGTSPKRTYRVKVTMHGGWEEDVSSWSMDVVRGDKPILSDYPLRPFYAWTCVNRGRARWQTEEVLHFTSYSTEGRNINPKFTNATGRPRPYTEVWMRSVDPQGYLHAPSLFLVFDLAPGASVQTGKGAQLFAGGRYFLIGCRSEGKTATARFRIPVRPGAPHGIDLTRDHCVTVTLTDSGPVIVGGAFEALTEAEAKTLVAKEIVPLAEEDVRRRGTVPPKAAPSPAQ